MKLYRSIDGGTSRNGRESDHRDGFLSWGESGLHTVGRKKTGAARWVLPVSEGRRGKGTGLAVSQRGEGVRMRALAAQLGRRGAGPRAWAGYGWGGFVVFFFFFQYIFPKPFQREF